MEKLNDCFQQTADGKLMFKNLIMPYRILTIFAGLALLLIQGESLPQSAFPSISAKVGVIRNLQDESFRDKPRYSFYPEIQIGGRFVFSSDFAVSLAGGLYYGYWDDGVGEASNSCRDCHTYSYNSHIVGARLSLILEKFPIIPLGMAFGLAHHFINAEYVGGSDLAGGVGQNFAQSLNTAEGVLFIEVPFHNRIRFLGEVQQFFALDNKNYSIVSPSKRRAFKLGFALHY